MRRRARAARRPGSPGRRGGTDGLRSPPTRRRAPSGEESASGAETAAGRPQVSRVSATPPEPASREALEAALAGGPERHQQKTAEQGKLARARAARAAASTPESFAEEGLLANWDAEGLGADGVVTGLARVGGRKVGADGQRSDREGGFVGPEDGREDPPDPGAGAGARAADDLPGRLRRRADHRPGADVPGPPRRRADLPQRGQALRTGAPGLPAVRALGGRAAPTSRPSATS